MCGISGFINFSNANRIGVQQLLEASRILAHRGPDDEGFVLFSAENEAFPCYSKEFKKPELQPQSRLTGELDKRSWKLGFMHRRLSIIDLLPEGHQPFWDELAGIWLTYNGEIYNYKSLKSELQSFGHQFHTQTDTEVLVKSWLQWGRDCVNHFDGMWSFALVDVQNSLFFASTDRSGIKPFYWNSNEFGFCFASEIKAFKAFGIPFKENPAAVSRFLAYGKSDESDATFFEGIFRLQAGTNLEINLQTFSRRIYSYHKWTINQKYDFQPHINEAARIEELQNRFVEMIRLRIQSDVPLGICLSGGIDSSTIAGLLAFADRQNRSNSVRKAFMATMPEGHSQDEFPFAKKVAEECGFDLIGFSPDKQSFASSLEDLIYTLDEPPPGPNAYSQYAVFEKVNGNGITVTLDGQGADELFAGYPAHSFAFVAEQLKAGILRGDSLEYVSQFLQKAIRNGMPEKVEHQFLFWKKPEFNMLNPLVFRLAGKKYDLKSVLNGDLLAEFTSTSLPFLLKAADRNSMRWSVESRMPFADFSPLVQFAFSLPGSSKIENGFSKSIFRKAAKAFVNQEVLNRKDKVGFSAPNRDWIAAIPKSVWEELLAVPNPWIDKKEVKKWLTKSDQADILLIWRVFAYLLWNKIFIQNQL
jgi:asparagine synthase (glutamine-hydrolysing)